MAETANNINKLVLKAISAYKNRFNHQPVMGAIAPGRVNLIGEHTDYNLGYVLPVAINRWVVVVAGLVVSDNNNPITGQSTCSTSSTIVALDFNDEIMVDLSTEVSVSDKIWANYPLGVAHIFQKYGYSLPNVNMVITSSVPIGSGLSSSAAAEVSVATLLEMITGITLDPVVKASWCREAEHAFPGVPCGIMDQMISILARKGCGLLVDCQTGLYEYVSMPSVEEAVLLIANTNVKHQLATTEYSLRRDQCENAIKQIQQSGLNDFKKIQSLRDIKLTDLQTLKSYIDPVAYLRVLHVIEENTRTLKAVEALRNEDLFAVGQMMYACHASLRDNYAVSCPELDYLVELVHNFSNKNRNTSADSGIYGSRMTGAGFGGCTITLCVPEVVEKLTAYLQNAYNSRFNRELTVFTASVAGGASAIKNIDYAEG